MTGVTGWPPLLELRQYTLHPGRRDELIDLFDTELLEPQEWVGMRVLCQFRDLDDPDRFVWLRGFRSDDADDRRSALAAFYGGPTWATHAAAANATMVDSDDVYLLAPATDHEPWRGVDAFPAIGTEQLPSVIDVGVLPLAEPPDGELRALIDAELRSELSRLADGPVALFGSADVPNTFSALPVREREPVVVFLARFDDAAAHAAYRHRLDAAAGWTEMLRRRLRGQPQRLRLAPTSRSRLR